MKSMESGHAAENLTNATYRLIKDKIICGEFRQGEVISISAIARTLKISRTPVNNACQKLEHDRLLTIVPKQGVVINPVSIAEAREIYLLRAAVETYSAGRSFAHITAADIAALQRLHGRMQDCARTGDFEGLMGADLDFHECLLTIQQNAQFLQVFESLWDKSCLLGLESCRRRWRLDQCLVEHGEVIAALEANDKAAFVQAVERNILNGLASLTGEGVRDRV